MGINQLQAAAAAGGPFSPASAGTVGHFVFLHVNGVGSEKGLGLGQDDQFAVMRQLAAVVAVSVAGIEIGVTGKQIVDILAHHHIAVGADDRVGWKRERDTGCELPAGQIDTIGPLIIEFNVLIIVVTADRVVHQFVDDDVANQN